MMTTKMAKDKLHLTKRIKHLKLQINILAKENIKLRDIINKYEGSTAGRSNKQPYCKVLTEKEITWAKLRLMFP